MKLIYCKKCQDVRKLDFAVTVCNCGASKGWYADDALNAVIRGRQSRLGLTTRPSWRPCATNLRTAWAKSSLRS